jgi:hypothetical protein
LRATTAWRSEKCRRKPWCDRARHIDTGAWTIVREGATNRSVWRAWQSPAFAGVGGISAKLTLVDAQDVRFEPLNDERLEQHVP